MELETIILTIGDGQSVSDAADLTEKRLVGLISPAAFDGSTLDFETSVDGIIWVPANTPTGSLRISPWPTASSRFVLLDNVAGWRDLTWLKAVGSTQSASRDITLVVTPRTKIIELSC